MANLIIKMNTANNIILTLNERVDIDNPFYLFHFISKFNKNQERLFYAENISNNKIRYDEFLIKEEKTPDTLNGEINLYTGEWKYNIYQTDKQDYDIENLKLLETGLLIVI